MHLQGTIIHTYILVHSYVCTYMYIHCLFIQCGCTMSFFVIAICACAILIGLDM